MDENNKVEPKEEKKWYVVNTYAGHENRVKDNLERRIKTMGMEDNLFKIIVAEETEIDFKNGKKIEKTRNLFPGYIFVEMIMSDDAWYQVRNTPGVTGFIGSSGGGAKPLPVAEEEIQNVLRKLGMSEQKIVANFGVGDRVRILSGPFTNVEGTVESMNDDTEVATVLTIMFGHETPTDISYLDLEKVD
ncbi:MAG: transcription termination/antitermination factor NusG [Erysipelotrichaceae bacterium]|nr:transcription termination/antitermination factor NusG [Erysipelotrichaceae bacterium]